MNEWTKVGAEWRRGEYSLAIGEWCGQRGWYVFQGVKVQEWLRSLRLAKAWVEAAEQIESAPADGLLADLAKLRVLVDYLPTGKTGEAVALIDSMEYQLKRGVTK